MSYESEPLYKLIKITKQDVFTAVCLGIFMGICLWTFTSSALTVKPSQELGKTLLGGQTLQVKPVEVTSFSQIDNPSDIQPATGYNMVERTANPQL